MNVEHELDGGGGARSTRSKRRTTTLRMAMEHRTREKQAAIWVAGSELPWSVSPPFFEKLPDTSRCAGSI